MMTAHQVTKDNKTMKEENGLTIGQVSDYEIRIAGKLDPSWSDWFDGLKITYQNDETLLVGVIADQAALLGILTKIGRLNLTLLSVNILENRDG
jgi:hypothetical protein